MREILQEALKNILGLTRKTYKKISKAENLFEDFQPCYIFNKIFENY